MGARKGTPADLRRLMRASSRSCNDMLPRAKSSAGLHVFSSHQDLIADLDPSQENAARLMAQLAIWTDIGFAGRPLREVLKRFEAESIAIEALDRRLHLSAPGRGNDRDGGRDDGDGDWSF